MGNDPLVTAYIPTRNRAGLLKKALDSVLAQSWQSLEVVVVDDASEDETPDLLKELEGNFPVTVVRNPFPKGAAASRNIAIEHASGEFVAGLDDDDTWFPERIERLIKNYEDEFSAVCAYDKMVFNNKEMVWKKKTKITFQDLLYYNKVGNQVLTKKSFIVDVNGYDESLPAAQDYDLWIRLSQKYGPVKCVPEVLQIVNMQNNSNRITTSETTIDGYRACFNKHKHLMSKQQKTYQNYRLKLSAGEPVSWYHLFTSVPLHLLKKEITRKLFL